MCRRRLGSDFLVEAEWRSYLECLGNACMVGAHPEKIEMNSNRKRKPIEHDRAKLAREHQEEELDDALKNTFPASDPVSIVRSAPPEPDRD